MKPLGVEVAGTTCHLPSVTGGRLHRSKNGMNANVRKLQSKIHLDAALDIDISAVCQAVALY